MYFPVKIVKFLRTPFFDRTPRWLLLDGNKPWKHDTPLSTGPGRKLGKFGNFFPRFINPNFRFWLQHKIENLEIRKLGIIFQRFLRFPRFPSFRFPSFSFFKKLFFSIFYSRQFCTFYLCYVLFSKPFKAFFPSPKIYVQNITLSLPGREMRYYLCCEMHLYS